MIVRQKLVIGFDQVDVLMKLLRILLREWRQYGERGQTRWIAWEGGDAAAAEDGEVRR